MNKDAVEVVRCCDCVHFPRGSRSNHDIKFPDGICPCQCQDDDRYSWKPDDNWFCADGERKTVSIRSNQKNKAYKWGKVTDTLPKKAGKYLITCDDDNSSMEVAYFNGEKFEIYSCIAWMELPEAFKD